MVYEHLENKFDDLDDSFKEKFLSEVNKERINPTDRKNWSKFPKTYERGRSLSYKYAWSDAIVKFFKEKGDPLDIINSEYLYSKLNKAVMKRIYYGMLSTPDIPKEVLQRLEDWDKVCLYAGTWAKRNTEDVKDKSLTEIVGAYVKEGYNKLHWEHVKRKISGEYKTTLKLPGSQKYHKNKKILSSIESIEQLFEEEGKHPTDELNERIAIALDSLSKDKLIYLSKKYGKEKLGDYYQEEQKTASISQIIPDVMKDLKKTNEMDENKKKNDDNDDNNGNQLLLF